MPFFFSVSPVMVRPCVNVDITLLPFRQSFCAHPLCWLDINACESKFEGNAHTPTHWNIVSVVNTLILLQGLLNACNMAELPPTSTGCHLLSLLFDLILTPVTFLHVVSSDSKPSALPSFPPVEPLSLSCCSEAQSTAPFSPLVFAGAVTLFLEPQMARFLLQAVGAIELPDGP